MIYRRLIIALAAALALSVGGHAQMAPWQPLVLIPAPGAPSYTGPGDVVSGATAWYGLRAYNAAYATGSNNAVNIRRASDNTTSNIVILANGSLDTVTAASFAGTDATCTGTISFDDAHYLVLRVRDAARQRSDLGHRDQCAGLHHRNRHLRRPARHLHAECKPDR